MSTAPKASIIITCYNYGKYLRDSLVSALGQTYPNYDVLIVDDGSKDLFTINILQELKNEFPQIKFIIQENQGPSAARNTGVKNSDAKYFMQLDGDDQVEATYLEKAIRIMEPDTQLSPVYCDVSNFGDNSEKIITGDWTFERIIDNNFIVSCPVFSRQSWEACNGYDERIKGIEDYEFYFNLAKKGFIGKRIPEYLLIKRIHETEQVSYNRASSINIKKNDWYFDRKHGRTMLARFYNLIFGKLNS